MATAYVGIGSNIEPEKHLRAAAALLRSRWSNTAFSRVYASKAQLHVDQPDFLNAVCRMETKDTPEEMHTALRDIESTLGKAPPFRFGPRTIDLDLLLYDDLVLPDAGTWGKAESALTLPHPRMHERRFVLAPLAELMDPEQKHPVLVKAWHTFLRETGDQDVRPTDIAL